MTEFFLFAMGISAGFIVGMAVAFFILRGAKPTLPF